MLVIMQTRVAVVGMGYWGPKFARNLHLHPEFELVAVCDLDTEKAKAELARINAQNVNVYDSINSLLQNEEIRLVHIAVPPQFHFEVASVAISHGKSVLIEKPVGLSQTERENLVALALNQNVDIFVDHTYLFTSEFSEILKFSTSNEIGDLIFFNSTRVNLGLIQSDTNVIEDLAVHDLALLDVLKQELPLYVNCTGITVLPSKVVSTAFATLTYPDNFVAQIMVSWNSPVKVREIQLAGAGGMIIWDDMSGSDKVKIYNSSIRANTSDEEVRISYHLGEGRIPSIIATEAIKRELDYISGQMRNPAKNQINGTSHILRVGKTLSALVASLNAKGAVVHL